MATRRSLVLVVFSLITFLFIYKLDYPYFFTDEVLYVDSGREHLKGVYTSTMHVPLITKYIAGVMYSIADHNVLLLRIPFALMGVLSAIVLYKILEREFGYKWGLLGAMLFTSSEIIYTSTRMVMLEALMHLSWLLFLYLYYLAMEKRQASWFLYSGIFLGLALSSKITSVILIPFTLVFAPHLWKSYKSNHKVFLTHYLIMYTTGFGILAATYIHTLSKLGVRNTIRAIYDGVNEGYLEKSTEGKKHIIDGRVYTKSPYWSYAYFVYAKEGILRISAYVAGAISAVLQKNLFVCYWGMFFIMSLAFYQFSGVKNVRYVASFEIPLIIMATAGFYYLSKRSKYLEVAIISSFFCFFTYHAILVVTQIRTEYNALFEYYLKEETDNYNSSDKIYIYGSIRSGRWYKHGKAVGRDMFEISSDLEAHCPEFQQYDYLIIEKDELERYGNNIMLEHAEKNKDFYESSEQYGFLIFKRLKEGAMNSICRQE
ncbi:MAG: glycosyltransferase family 39 protein [Patescibacteria group bacterium]|jgi:4-amino-4-deoxy-L-arabinose transferase-like glycosyltransferase